MSSSWRLVSYLILLLLISTAVSAWDGPPQQIGGGIGGLIHPVSFVDGTLGQIYGPSTLYDSRLRGNFVLQDDGTDNIQANFKAQNFHLTQDYPLINTGALVPLNLWAIDVGGSYLHKLKSGDQIGAFVSFGSDSDIPFNSVHELAFSVSGIYHHPVDRNHSWFFLLNEATPRSFAPGVPIPGVGYMVIYPEHHLVAFYGIPFFLSWQPLPDWNFKFVYFIPTVISAEASYQFAPPIKLHIGFDWVPQSWLRANHSDDSNELILNQMKATLGLRSPVGDRMYVDLSGGYAFDQTLFEAHSLLSSGISKTYLPAGALLQLELAFRL